MEGHDRTVPPPYQPIDPLLRPPRNQVPFALGTDRVLGRYGATVSVENPAAVYPVTKPHSCRNLWFICIFSFLAGAVLGYMFDFTVHEVQRIKMRDELAKWKNEKAAMDAERKKWEEEQTKHRAHLTWQDLRPGHCLRYATREYMATLSNVAVGMDGIAECGQKSIDIHGRSVMPNYCNLEGPCGLVTGHWSIDFGEAGCTPWWDSLSDKGCDGGMRKHRYEARLSNLQTYDDWEVLCKTTPTTIKGVHYEGATSCIDSIWGKFGVWFVEDNNCR